MRFLDLVRPLLVVLPEVSNATRRVPFREKVLWTVITLLIFLVCCQIPLYGIRTQNAADPFYWYLPPPRAFARVVRVVLRGRARRAARSRAAPIVLRVRCAGCA